MLCTTTGSFFSAVCVYFCGVSKQGKNRDPAPLSRRSLTAVPGVPVVTRGAFTRPARVPAALARPSEPSRP